ncbi:MAG: hypothetical protein AAFP19_25895, partial [Bacteroidota bacterium]
PDKRSGPYQESLQIYQQLAKTKPQRFRLELTRTLLSLSYLKKNQLEALLDLKYQKEGIALINQADSLLQTFPSSIPLIQDFKDITQSLRNYFEQITLAELQVQQQINAIAPIEAAQEKETKPALIVASQERIIFILDSLYQKLPDNQSLITRLSNEYGSLAWFYLFTQQFQEAEQAAVRGLALDESQEWIHTHWALALLYQGQFEEAKAIYTRLKDEPYGEGTYQSVFLEDIAALEEAGIRHPDSGKIKVLLEREE